MKKIIFLIIIFIIPELAIAGWPGECTYIKIPTSTNLVYKGSTSINWKYTVNSSGNITLTAGVISYSGSYYNTTVETWYYDGGWIKKDYGNCIVTPNNGNLDFEYTVTDILPQGCPVCVDEKEALVTECGSEENVDWTNWSDETCSGASCKPCLSDGDETEAQVIERCGTSGYYYSEEQCSGYCGCSEYQYQAALNRCSPGQLDYFIESICDGPCVDCGEKKLEAIRQCILDGGETLRNFECVGGYVINEGECVDDYVTYIGPDNTPADQPTTEITPNQPTPTPSDITQEPSSADPTDNTDVAGWLQSIKENSDTEISQNNSANQQLNNQTEYLKNIADNISNQSNNDSVLNDKLEWIGKNEQINANLNSKIAINTAEMASEQSAANQHLTDIKSELSKNTGWESISDMADPTMDTDLTDDTPGEEDTLGFITSKIDEYTSFNAITNSSITYSDTQSCMTLANPLTGQNVNAICFSDYESILNKMGLLLFAISCYTALCIAVGVKG